MNETPEPRRINLSYEVRILVCPTCGAPYESAPEARSGTCAHCGATHTLAARDETIQIVGDKTDRDEARRLARLRGQVGDGLIVPKRFLEIATKHVYDDDDRATIESAWKEARDVILAGKGDEGWELCLYSATWFHWTVRFGADNTRRRAHAESALELLTDPKYRHRIRCKLAGTAARMNELEAAERWIGPCDPRPDDLLTDSEYRSARAMIELRRGRFEELLRLIGDDASEVPLHRSMGIWLGLMRANAHEQLGRIDKATEQLVAIVGREPATVDRMTERDDLPDFCAKSLPLARARVAAINASCFGVEYPHLTCEHCGADFEVSGATTEVRCSYCGAISAVGLHPLVKSMAFDGIVPGASDISPERREALLAQRETWSIPPDLEPLFHEGRLRAECVPQAEAAWRKEVGQVAAEQAEATYRLMLLTSTLLTIGFGSDEAGRRHARALLETTLRVMRDPKCVQRLHCTIAIAAAEAGDFEAAAMWLARSEAYSDDHRVFSSYVLAHARIANLRGEYQETVRLLGPREGDLPVSLQSRVWASLLRATALERLDRTNEAVTSLMPILRWDRGARHALVQFVADAERDKEAAPTKSLARALAIHRSERTTRLVRVIVIVLALLVALLLFRRP